MVRTWYVAGLLCLVGCATANGPMDLVYGPQRIPPPSTGSAGQLAARGPYYPGSNSSAGSSTGNNAPARPSQPLPSTTPGTSNAVSPGSSPYMPPDGTFDYRGSSSSGASSGSGSNPGSSPFRPLSTGGAGSSPSSGNRTTSPFQPLGPPRTPASQPGSSQPGGSSPGSAARPAAPSGAEDTLARDSSGWKPAGSASRRSGGESPLFAQRRRGDSRTDTIQPVVRPVRYEIPQGKSNR